MALVLSSFCPFFFTQHLTTRISYRVPLRCTMFHWINELPEDELNSFARETSRNKKKYGLVEKLNKVVPFYT